VEFDRQCSTERRHDPLTLMDSSGRIVSVRSGRVFVSVRSGRVFVSVRSGRVFVSVRSSQLKRQIAIIGWLPGSSSSLRSPDGPLRRSLDG